MSIKELCNRSFNFYFKKLNIGNAHTICLEYSALFRLGAKDYLLYDFCGLSIELLNTVLLSLSLNIGAHLVAKELYIVIYAEPLILIFAEEVYGVRYLKRNIYIVLCLCDNNIRNLVVINAEICSRNKLISCLRLSSRKIYNLKCFIIVKHTSCRTDDGFALTRLGYYIYCIASPRRDCYNTFILSVKDNCSRLCVRSAARDICVCRKDSKSLLLIGSRISIVDNICLICLAHARILFSLRFVQSKIILKNFSVAGVESLALLRSKNSLNHYLSTRIRKIHSRTYDSLNITCKAVKDVAALARRNCDSVMHILAIILNHRVLRSRIVDLLILTCKEELLADRMFYTILLIFCDNLKIDTANIRKFKCAEDYCLLRCLNKSLSRLREYHCRTVNISLISRLILKNTVLKALKGDRVAHILIGAIFNCKYFNACRRNIERYLSTFDYKKLTCEIGFLLHVYCLTLCIKHCCALKRVHCRICVIDSCKKILVSTKLMSANYLGHLTREEREGSRTSDIYLYSNLHRSRSRISFCRLGIYICRVLEYCIPTLRRRCKELLRAVIIACFNKSLTLLIEDYKRLLLRNSYYNRSDMATNSTCGLIKYKSVLVNCEYKVGLSTSVIVIILIEIHIFLPLFIFIFYFLSLTNILYHFFY